MFGGMTLCSKAKTILMTLEIPDAPSEWPRFGLTWQISLCSLLHGIEDNTEPM